MLTVEIKHELRYRGIVWKTLDGNFHKYHGVAITTWDHENKPYWAHWVKGLFVKGSWER